MHRIIYTVDDVDFHTFADDDPDYTIDGDNIEVQLVKKHGTLLFVAGACEDDDNALVCFGVPEGEEEGRIAFHPDFKRFEDAWNELIKGFEEGSITA